MIIISNIIIKTLVFTMIKHDENMIASGTTQLGAIEREDGNEKEMRTPNTGREEEKAKRKEGIL